jgi:hypothetical protein
LPSRTDSSIPVPLTLEQELAHGELDQPIAQLVRRSMQRPLIQAEFLRLMSLMTRQRIICNGLAQRDFEQTWPQLEKTPRPTEAALRGLFSPKLIELRDLLANLVVTQGRKVVVFSQWKRMLKLAEWATSDILGDAGIRAVHFTGDESHKRRTQNIVDFHDEARTGDMPWNPAVFEQRSGRIYRLGQTKPVDVYALIAASGIESRIASIVGDKKALFDGLFDGSSDEVRFEKGGSFISTMQRMLAPVELPSLQSELEEEEPQEPRGDVLDSTSPAPAPTPALESLPGANPQVKDFMQGIRVERLPDGRTILEAQPEAAANMAAMLEGMAGLLKQLSAR